MSKLTTDEQLDIILYLCHRIHTRFGHLDAPEEREENLANFFESEKTIEPILKKLNVQSVDENIEILNVKDAI